ncbi:MAG: hypothetical protein MJ157_01470 [Clostridia bacterium]|nr:hypothetical protein [Clostridia bacterium]
MNLVKSCPVAKEFFRETEQRLYAFPILVEKLDDDRERLTELMQEGLSEHSKCLVRLRRSGTRLSSEEIIEALTQDLQSNIARDEYEVGIMERALQLIQSDPYYYVVPGKYFERLNDEDVADKIGCDASTVWRHRKRLIACLAVRLYGTIAIH